jgi:outer membrane protein OmpA-like peptidoglycan-associated protein
VIVFEKNQTELSPAAIETMKAAALALTRYPSGMLLLRGHASPHETDSASLSQRRARRAAGFIINHFEVDPRRMSLTSRVDLEDSPIVELIVGQEPAPKADSTKQAHKIN